MAIIRTKKGSIGGYTQVDNGLINDKRLSWTAKGLLVYMLSKRDDYKFNEKRIAYNTGSGISELRAAIKLLIELKYIKRTRHYENGRFKYYEYEIIEKPETVFIPIVDEFDDEVKLPWD